MVHFVSSLSQPHSFVPWKEVVVVCFNVLSLNLPGGNEIPKKSVNQDNCPRILESNPRLPICEVMSVRVPPLHHQKHRCFHRTRWSVYLYSCMCR
jgi:hypothetical protein